MIGEGRLDIKNYLLILHGRNFVVIAHTDMQKHKIATNCSFALEFLMQLTQDVKGFEIASYKDECNCKIVSSFIIVYG